MPGEMKIDFEKIEKYMAKLRPKTVLLQLPEGLKRKAGAISDEVRRRFRCEVLISGDSCYGSCDIPSVSIDLVDAIIQAGHWEMPTVKTSKPILFLPVNIQMDLRKLIKSAMRLISPPVGLLTTSQHVQQIKEAKALLEKEGVKVMIGKGSRRAPAPGLILGCDYSNAREVSDEVASFLLLGGGRFHAIGLRLSTGKPVIIIDPERSKAVVEDIDIEAFERRRFLVIMEISKAKSIGILVSSKPGQNRMSLARRLLSAVREGDRDGHIVVLDEVTPDSLLNLGFDAYVSTACPRIALDDAEKYHAPIGTPAELMVALSKLKWEHYRIDEWGIDPTCKVS